MTSIAQARGCFSSAVLIMRIIRYGTVTFFFTDRKTGISANDGKWHAICVTWNNDDGTYQFFRDGQWKNKRQTLRRATLSRLGDLWFLDKTKMRSAATSKKTRALKETWLGLMCGPMSCQKTLSLLFLNLAPVTLESEETSTNGPILCTELKDVPRLKFPLLVSELA